MGDTLILLDIGFCKYPFSRLLVFTNKIIMIESGVCNFSFVKEEENNNSEQPDERCSTFTGTMSSRDQCTYKGKTMEQVYQIILNKNPHESKHLKNSLPPNNIKYNSNVDNEGVQISYEYENKNKLLIELFYEGGITVIEIQEKNGYTVSKITYNAD